MKINYMLRNKILVILTIILIFIFLYISNNWIQTTEYSISSNKINTPIKIVHLSDLHGKQFGHGNVKLIEKIKKEKPDIIIFTGDLIDAYRNTNIKESVTFLEKLSESTPVYYIRGNHEYRSTKYYELMDYLHETPGGVHVLNGGYEKINIKGNQVNILGLDVHKNGVMKKFLSEEGYKIILHHYSENFSTKRKLSQLDVDLVLTGHGHGGQFRLPFIGGVFSPGQGFMPKYSEGIHEENNSIQIISRGLGNSIFPFRLFNRPEIITITINNKE